MAKIAVFSTQKLQFNSHGIKHVQNKKYTTQLGELVVLKINWSE